MPLVPAKPLTLEENTPPLPPKVRLCPTLYPNVLDSLSTPGDAYFYRLHRAAARGGPALRILDARQRRIRSLRPNRTSKYDPNNPWESVEQADLNDYLNTRRLLWFHCPNERSSPKQAKVLSTQGAKSGVPDILILSPPPGAPGRVGVAIELKRRKSPPSAASPSQRQWLEQLRGCGWVAEVAHGAGPAVALIEQLYGRDWLP